MTNRSIIPIKIKRALKGSLFGLLFAGMLSLQAPGAQESSLPETGSQEELINSPIALDVVYGYQNIAKSGRFLPLRIEVKNQEARNFRGTLCVLAMESELKGYTMDQEYDVYRYEYPLEVKASGSLVQDLSISLGARVDQMYVKVLDESGREVVQKRLKLNLNLETAELFIGVLSDNPAKLLYLNGVGINYSTLRTRTIEMNAASLPVIGLGLDQLDVLLITDFDTGKLSGQQIEAVWEWVQKGGVLLFGTGARGEDTLRGFAGELLEDPLPQPGEYVVNMGVEYAVDGPEGASIPLTCTEVPLNGATEVLSSDELSVVSSVAAGKGMAAVSIYDFGDIEDFCQANVSYIDNLFFNLLGEDKVNLLASSRGGSTSEQYWSVQSLINTGDVNKLPRVGLYVTLAVAYVALAGPGLYFFFKQRGMRQYYQLSVAVLSVCCTGMVIIMGMSTRFSGPFFTYATIKDTDSGEISETTFINMRAPYNKAFSVELDSSYTLYPITGNAYYDMTPMPKFTGNESPAITIRYGDESSRIEADGVGAFNSKFFQMERNKKNDGDVGFTGSINSFDGQVTGTITNHYDQEVESVAVLLYNQMIFIDRMAPGETVELDDKEVIYGATNFGYAMAEQITGASRYKRDGNIEDAEYVEALERTNLLNFYMSNYLSGYHSEARVVAFSKEKDETDFLIKPDYETYGSTLLTSPVDVNYEKDGMIYRSAMQKKPNVLSGEYYAPNNTMYGLTPVMLEYYLGNDIEVEKLNFYQLDGQVAESMRYYYMVPFSGKMYFYNYNSGNYDSMNKGMTEYTKDQLEPYLSPGNTLTVKYVYDTSGEYNWNIMLPTLTVTGRSK
ncbi:MAG: hypothetical protein LIP16_13890 [Clostridium sp.]|nr:hypothetical protein [Clostridium sp.]